MNYKGFKITTEKYIEERHPQYNYLGFTARQGKKYLTAIFYDFDIRLKTEEELLKVFLEGLDRFIEYNTDTSALHYQGDDIVRTIDNKGNDRNIRIKSRID